jgi:hypothetical protein
MAAFYFLLCDQADLLLLAASRVLTLGIVLWNIFV